MSAGHVARMGKMRVAYIISVGRVKERYNLGENGIQLRRLFTMFKTAHWPVLGRNGTHPFYRL
jgi:hypothetical protein